MIYLFLGETYFRTKLLNTWIDSFKKKFDENNIFIIKNISDYDLNFLSQNLFSVGLFSTKNLFIIEDFDFSNLKYENYTNFFIDNLENINGENILVFSNNSIDKRNKLFKIIQKKGEIKDFSILDKNDLINKIYEIYKNNLDKNFINKLIEKKGLNIDLCINEIEKLLITNNKINIKDLDNITNDSEQNIFEIIDNFLNLNYKLALENLKKMYQDFDNQYYFYTLLVSNFRIFFYIFNLKNKKVSNDEISSLLNIGNRKFLLNKSYKISLQNFNNIYNDLISIDGKMKTGKLIGSQKNDFYFEIQNIFLKNKKDNF